MLRNTPRTSLLGASRVTTTLPTAGLLLLLLLLSIDAMEKINIKRFAAGEDIERVAQREGLGELVTSFHPY